MKWLLKPNVKPQILAVDSFSQRGICDDNLATRVDGALCTIDLRLRENITWTRTQRWANLGLLLPN